MNNSRQLFIKDIALEFDETFGGDHARALRRAWTRGKEHGIAEYRKLCNIRASLSSKKIIANRKANAARDKKAQLLKAQKAKNQTGIRSNQRGIITNTAQPKNFFSRTFAKVKNFFNRKR